MGDIRTQRPSTLLFFCNGKKITLKDVDPEVTLLTFLRSKLLLQGTKDGCSQGACGACTVMISRYDSITKKIVHWSATACLTQLCSLHGVAVTTVEGIGSTKDRLHPVQERIAKAHGSQCGFCTPGFVMSMYTLLRNKPTPSMDDIRKYLEGNLCRCTGYRPILEGCKTFTEGCCGGSTSGECCQSNQPKKSSEGESLCQGLFEAETLTPYDPSQEIIFPPELMVNTHHKQDMATFIGERVTWYIPSTLNEILYLKMTHREAKLIAGNTSLGLYLQKLREPSMTLISCTSVQELHEIKSLADGFLVGAAVTLEELESFLKQQVESLPADQTMGCAIVDMLKKYSSQQIKNVATIGGHIASASPSSDLNPLLMAAGASVHVTSAKAERMVKLDEKFFLNEDQIAIRSEEIIKAIFIPKTSKDEFIRGYKQPDGTVKAGFRIKLCEGTVSECCISVGGLSSSYKLAVETMKAVTNRFWNKDILDIALDSLIKEFNQPAEISGGAKSYYQSIPASLFVKFFVYVSQHLPSDIGKSINIPDSWVTAGQQLSSGEFRGVQLYPKTAGIQASYDLAGHPTLFKSAFQQASGEALYVDDLPSYQNELHLGIVFSQKPHAKILKIDFNKARGLPGVYDIISADDVPGTNEPEGEILFATDKVTTVGQAIAGIIAESATIARQAVQLVCITYEDLEPILSIQDAARKGSYFGDPITFQNGDAEAAFKKSDNILEGEVGTNAQEHMYLEPHAVKAVPNGEHGEMEISATSQDLRCLQLTVATVLGVQYSRIVVRTKRVGGAFGGKGDVITHLSAITAVAAHKTNRPVRLALSREEDMQCTGTRHPYLAKYKVGCSKDGKVEAVQLKIWANCGHIRKNSYHVMIASLMSCNASYRVPVMDFTGYLCKTNLPSSTAFRGFGSPQIHAITETWMTHLAVVCKLSQKQARERNLLQEGDLTPINQQISSTFQRCWDECLLQSNYSNRLEEVQKFNSRNKWIKKGIAINPAKFLVAAGSKGGALVHIYTDGSVLITHGGIEYGQGLYTKTIQVVNRCLGVPVEKIHITETATDKVANARITGGSVTTDLIGFALKVACDSLSERLAPFKKANPDGSWEDWVMAAYHERIDLSATGFYSAPRKPYDPKTNTGTSGRYFTYGVAVCEVEVDCLTGIHKLLRTDIVMDVGKSLNPAVDIGQIEGGFIQGYGMFALEDHKWSPCGHYMAKGPLMYHAPRVSNVFGELNVTLLTNSEEPRAIFSSKGIGEPTLLLGSAAHCAIWEAVNAARRDAGVNEPFCLNVPAIPEEVRLACKDDITQKCSSEVDVSKPAFYRR